MAKIRVKQVEDIHTDEAYLKEDLKVTTKLGEVQSFDEGKTYATIKATHDDGTKKTVQEVLEELLSKDTDPTVQLPTTTATLTPGGTTVECGASVTPKATPTLTDGTYSVGGQDTAAGCRLTRHTLTLKVAGTKAEDQNTTTDGATVTFKAVTAPSTEGGTVTVDVETSYGAGNTPLSALENERPALAIAAGTAKATGLKVCTAKRGRFYGCADAAPATSAAVRALMTAPNLALAKGSTFNIVAPAAGAKAMVFALPASLGLKLSAANMTTSLNADVKDKYSKTTVQVNDASGANAVAYDVYTYAPSDPFKSGATCKIVLG